MSEILDLKMFEDNKFYSPKEVAEKLGISKEAVYNWIYEKKVDALRVGKFWKIKGKEINEKIIRTN